MYKRLLMTIITSVFLVSCQSEPNKTMVPGGNQVVENPTPTPSPSPSTEPTPEPTPTPISEDSEGVNHSDEYSGDSNFKAELVDGDGPDKYKVKLTWNWSKNFKGKFKVMRYKIKVENQEPPRVFYIGSSIREFEDFEYLKNGSTYQYVISLEDQSKSIGNYEVFVPKDLIFKKGFNDLKLFFGKKYLKNNVYIYSGHRIFFEEGAVVASNGKGVEFYSDYISYENAVVDSRSREIIKKCRPYGIFRMSRICNEQYQDSGSIKIFAKKYVTIAGVKTRRPVLTLISHSLNGLSGESGKDGRNGYENGWGFFWGEDSGQGKRGFDASDAGDIEVKITDFQKYNPIFIWFANGGLGGEGGSPGKPGLHNQNGDLCKSFPQDCRDGALGKVGDNGSSGKPAKSICFEIDGVAIGCQNDFPFNGIYDGYSVTEVDCSDGYDAHSIGDVIGNTFNNDLRPFKHNKCSSSYKWKNLFPEIK
jgi:hypothetical protein